MSAKIVQEHREYKKDAKNGCFIIATNEEDMYKALKEYADLHPESDIWIYKNPVRPSKENYRPEYSMEVELANRRGFFITWFMLYRKAIK